ncbi:MAG: 3-deoxy-D-manno-octulosonic acid kinase [Cognaticolwellia sp.]
MNQPAIVKHCHEKNYQQGNVYCQYDSHEITDFLPEMLDSEYWQAKKAIVGSAQGRGTTWFIASKSSANVIGNWVLRHYYRGGLIGKLINDQYLYTGLKNTRAAREFSLLKSMRSLGLPAPKPIAFRVVKQGLSYRADLLSSRIENASDLVALLSKNAIDDLLWQRVGEVIKTFHQQGIYHHDLNAHNILIDDNKKVWLIDFDQGEQRKKLAKWPAENMARLLRSFRKESKKVANFQWREENWQALLSGYQA